MNAIDVSRLSHRYSERLALRDLNLSVVRGEVFVLLGPNGGGKTTLFRVLSTLIPPQSGKVRVLDHCVQQHLDVVRRYIGVVFQSPSLDRKLTVDENLSQQAALYGLGKNVLRQRRNELLDQLGLTDRRHDLVETLSGGLKRRVDLAKGMLHRPEVLLLDEPSTGLDPGARADLWQYLRRLRDVHQTTIVLTSHLLDEANRADRVAILHRGELVALDRPAALQASLGGDSLTVETDDATSLAARINLLWPKQATVVDRDVRLEVSQGQEWIGRLLAEFPQEIKSLKLGKPTLEDVFIQKTGHRFCGEPVDSAEKRAH